MFLQLLLIFSTIGFLLSYYIYFKDKGNGKLTCFIGKGCNNVIRSKYSNILGIKTTIVGMAYYSFFIFISLIFLFYGLIFSEYLFSLLFLVSSAALVFSLVLLFIQLLILREFCDYCFFSLLINISIFVLLFVNFNLLRFLI